MPVEVRSRPIQLKVAIVLQWVCVSVVLISCETQLSSEPEKTSSVPQSSASETFLKLAERHASLILQTAPEWATQLGVSEQLGGRHYDRLLSDYSPAGNARLYSLNRKLLAELHELDRGQLSGTAEVTYDVMLNAYETAARQNKHQIGVASLLGANPPYAVNQLFSPHIDLPRLFTSQQSINNPEELDNYLARLSQVDRVIGEVGDLVEADAHRGFMPPAFSLEAVASSARGFVSSAVDQHPIVSFVKDQLADMKDNSMAQSGEAVNIVTTILTEEIYPAYLQFAHRVETLAETAPTDAGIWRLEKGAELYQIALNAYGANGLTAEQIHQIGLTDSKRIQTEMDSILRAHGYIVGTVGTRMEALASQDAKTIPNTDESKEKILTQLDVYVDQVMALAPQWFTTLPTQPIEVRRIPVYEENTSAGAYYTPPSLDGIRPGVFWINLKNTADWPSYTLKSLTFHEGVPGHHFQVGLQQGVDDMPLIRNMLFYSDYGEGWALYAEALAVEMGLYQTDPLGNLGRLKAELYRAARLVVDTGLHYKRWTREQAVDWMVLTTGDTRPSIQREIERYAVWPGQATSYKLGMIRLQKLRAHAEAELGSEFEIGAFHDAILLDGSMPMPVLEARIDSWIREQQRIL